MRQLQAARVQAQPSPAGVPLSVHVFARDWEVHAPAVRRVDAQLVRAALRRGRRNRARRKTQDEFATIRFTGGASFVRICYDGRDSP